MSAWSTDSGTTSDFGLAIEQLPFYLGHDAVKALGDEVDIRLAQSASFLRAAADGGIRLLVDGRLDDDPIAMAKVLCVKVAPLGIQTVLTDELATSSLDRLVQELLRRPAA